MHLPSVSNSSIPSQPPSPSSIPKLFAPDMSARSHAQILSAQSSSIIFVQSRSLADLPSYHQPDPRYDLEHECTCGVNILAMSAQHQLQLCPRSHWIHHLVVADLATFCNNTWFSDYPLPEWSHLKTWYRYALSPPGPTIFDIDLVDKVQASWGGPQSSNT